MKKEEKLKKLLADDQYKAELTSKFLRDQGLFDFKFTINQEPENYVRERYTGRGHRFYNAKEKIMKQMNKDIAEMIPETYKKYFKKMFEDETDYYVKIFVDFYVKIPKADSVETTVLKEMGLIKPAISPDLDNFIKLLADVMHEVIYKDDKRIVGINATKRYSLSPRTEVSVEVYIPNLSETNLFKK
jgi:Holliday junction resolvase RusA-like endonuclease